MSYILRLPPIFTAPSEEGKIEQIRTYLYQTIKDIEFSLNAIDSNAEYTVEARETDGASMFSVLKPMIIKSGDILNSYYNIIKSRLDDVYLSTNEYGRHHLVSGSITSFASLQRNGVTFISTDDSTEGMPDGFSESVGTINVLNSKVIIQLTDIRTGKMASKSYYSGNEGWSDWRVLIPS